MQTEAISRRPHIQTPHGDPTASSETDTPAEKAWKDALTQAKANSPQQMVTVKPGDNLTRIASRNDVTLAGVEKANPKITNPDLIFPGESVNLPKTVPSEVVSGIDNSRIKPIIAAMANANAADRDLRHLEHSRSVNRAFLSGAQAQSAQSWDSVRQATLTMLMNNNSAAYPELAAGREIRQLNALEPGNTKFAAANNAALAQATQSWQQMGITKPQLSPIIDAYNNVKGIAQELQDPHIPHNRAIASDLYASEQQANARLAGAIEKSLTDAANQAGGDPAARSKAMTGRAAYIQVAGPQDPGFQTAVDNANYELQVNKPAQAVANAYAKGGAEAGAQALKAATQGAGNSYYAGQIIQASQGTIDSITKDMGSLASSQPMPSRASMLGPTSEQTRFNRIYADLSSSVAAASEITVSGSLSSGGTAAANIVANSIAGNVPKNLMPYQNALYGNAASTTTTGGGITLTLATAAAMKQHGNSDLASYMAGGAAAAIQGLQSQTSSDVKDFFTTTATLNNLRATWGPFMTQAQNVAATNGYLNDHPDVRQKADAQLQTVSQAGDTAAVAEAAWNSYRGQLNGIDGYKDLAAAAKSLTGDNSSVFAVSQSTIVNDAIAAALAHPVSGQGGGSVVQALAASPLQAFAASPYIWGALRSGRSFSNAAAKAARDNFAVPIPDKMFTTLSFLGLALTAENTAAKGTDFSTYQGAATTIYNGLGLGKYSIEVASGLSKVPALKQLSWLKSVGNSTKVSMVNEAGELIKTDAPWWRALGSTYYGVGALASYLEAVDAFSNHDPVEGGLNLAEGVGATISAVGPRVADKAIGAWAGPVGAGIGLAAALGTVIYHEIKSSNEQAAYRSDSSKFLQRGLGLKPGVADALSGPSGQSDGSSASAVLQRYANAYHLSPGELLQRLNHEESIGKVAQVAQFINEAANMPKQRDGQYAVSQSSDNPKQVGTHVVMRSRGRYALPETVPYQAGSLHQLKYWADYLFGPNQLG